MYTIKDKKNKHTKNKWHLFVYQSQLEKQNGQKYFLPNSYKNFIFLEICRFVRKLFFTQIFLLRLKKKKT